MQRLLNPENVEFSNLPQGSPEWLDLRRGKRSASDTGAVVGSNPYSSPLAVWKDKCGLSKSFENQAMRNGRAREDEVRARANAERGETFTPCVVINGEYLASLDGTSFDGRQNLEVKCPVKSSKWVAPFLKRPCVETIPAYYVDQMIHQMATSGADETIYRVGIYDDEGNHERDIEVIVPYDNDRFIEIHTAWEALWPHIESMEPPEVTTVRDDDEWKAAELEFKAAKDQETAAAERVEQAKKRLIELAGEDAVGTTRGAVAFVRHGMRKGSIDYSAVPELDGVDLETYRKPPSPTVTVDVVKESKAPAKRAKKAA